MFVLGENHFRKCFFGNEDVWLVRKILFSGNWNPLTQKKCLWPRKSVYTSIFLSKHFRKMRERERERERACAREEKRRTARSRHWSQSRRRKIAIDGERGRSEIAIDASQDRAIDRDLGSRSPVVVDDFFSRLWLVFFKICVFLLLFQTPEIFSGKFFEMQPNTEKYFPFPEISISRKYVFSEKCFTATKHSLR